MHRMCERRKDNSEVIEEDAENIPREMRVAKKPTKEGIVSAFDVEFN